MIYVIATLVVQPGKSNELIAGAQPCIQATRNEQGCVSYDYVRDTEHPDTVLVIERWTTREALDAHLQTAHLHEWRAARKPLVKSTAVEIIHATQIEKL